MQLAVIVIALFCCCLAQEDGGQDVKPAAFDVVASQGFEAVNISPPDNATTEGGDKKRASQYHCYIPSLRAWKSHGEVFQLPGSNCIKYRCAYGEYDVVQEECQDWTGRCWHRGAVFPNWHNGKYYNHCVCQGAGKHECHVY